ncbi:hypothetical protein [Dyadobacter sp. MSC1_007]|jgi:hypothetical protein|uniref:hypothetical protein n=1 Tax=Dyadobacter sp. MSC1_007 TaxID=2909264 RepID=UPI00202FF4F0|nr:hypothetical protein [Dyadobacter sp. MSC1_007]
MALSAKQWAGIAVAVIEILVFSIANIVEGPAKKSKQLSVLPRQYATEHGDVCQNTLLEIK